MMKPVIGIICLILCMLQLSAQRQFTSWPGSRGRVSFASGSGVFLSDIPVASNYAQIGYIGGPPVAYCHPATGQPLMLANGSYVFNSNYDTIPNSGLISCGFDRYQVQFLPRPGFPRQIYVFTQYSGVGYITGLETGLQTRCSQQNQIGLYYTLIDLDLNGGLGGVVEKNVKLPFYGMYDCLAFVKHPSGQDYWLVSRANSSSMGAVRLSSAGFGSLVATPIGLGIGGDSYMLRCNITASPNGRMVALSTAGRPSYVFLYDFDPATGIFANYRFQWFSAQTVTGISFSPDNSKLYVTTAIQQPCGDEARLYQLDFNEANLDSSLYLVHSKEGYSYGEMQRGPDNAIWMGPEWHGFGRVFHGIRFPNQPKAACLYQDVRLDLGQDDYAYIPVNVPNDYIGQQPESQATRLGMPEEVVLCDNNIELTAPSGYNAYQWNTGETTRSITPQRPGSYWVVAGPAGFDRPTAYGVTTVRQGGAPIGLVKDTSACPGSALLLSIHSYFTQIQWSDGDTAHLKQVLPPGSKIYVTAIDPSGCRSWDSTCVNFRNFPRAEFGPPDTVLCAGQSLTLRMEYDMSSNADQPAIRWSNGGTGSSITVTQPGTYWGTISQNGCTSADTIRVAMLSSTAIRLGTDTTLCRGETLTLRTGAAGVQHLWSNGSTSDTLLVSQPGQYWVKVFTPACTVSDTINIQYANPPEQPFPRDTAFCQGQPIKLGNDASVAIYSYLWNTGARSPSITVADTGMYWLETRNLGGCTRRDTVLVSRRPAPIFTLGPDTVLCQSALLQLAPMPPQPGLTWNDGSRVPAFTVSTTGSYWASATGANGCTFTDTIFVLYHVLPIIKLGNDTAVCEGTPVQLAFTSNVTNLVWSTGATGTNTVTATRPGWYWAQGSNSGCTARDSIFIAWKPKPPANLLGPDTTVCEGTSLLLDATTPGATYNWNGLGTQPSFAANRPGSYWVDVNLNGCISRNEVRITHTLKPRFSLGNDTLLCQGQSLTLKAPVNAGVIQWQDGTNTPAFFVDKPGTYKLTITNACGTATDEIQVEQGPCTLQMPTAFTPNGDGLNDVFRVRYPEMVKEFKMLVYDRWGAKVFESSNARVGWDGKRNGILLPAGNYIYTIAYTSAEGKPGTLHGWVMLVR